MVKISINRFVCVIAMLLLAYNISLAQDSVNTYCHIQGEKDWKNVELRKNTDTNTILPKGFSARGESEILIKRKINDINDLRTGEIEEIEKKAASDSCCMVYLWFQTDKDFKYQYYYCWGFQIRSK